MVLRALAGGGTIENLSDAHDTLLLERLLATPASTPVLDCEDAGTTLRFLTAYAAVTDRRCVITGTARMQERPIGPLVEALRELGADITYLDQEGFPPLRLNGFKYSSRTEITVRADLSSQFVSALLLVAPALPQGLTVRFAGALSSLPYILLTAITLVRWGARPVPERETTATFQRGADGKFAEQAPQQRQLAAVHVPAGGLQADTTHTIEADWSSAAFAYSLLLLNALTLEADTAEAVAELSLPGLRHPSVQADSRIADWCALLGLQTQADAEGVVLCWGERAASAPDLNFTNCPDLALPFIVALAGLSAAADFSGLQNLRYKESDRLAALTTELARFGTELLELDEGEVSLVARPGAELEVNGQFVRTYNDHRMAMAFAPFALLGPISIENPGVVRKSFPDFWNVLNDLGFEVEFTNEEPPA